MEQVVDTRIRDLINELVRLAESCRSQQELATAVARMVKETGANDRDIALAFSTLVTALQEHLNRPHETGQVVACSFCRKSQHEVKTIVQGPSAAICNECVAICADTVSSRPGLLRRIFKR